MDSTVICFAQSALSSCECCAQMQHGLDNPNIPLIYTAKFREVGIKVPDGGDSTILLLFCPWCGTKLPASLRSEWFAELELRKIDPYGQEYLPSFGMTVGIPPNPNKGP
jgi:hypothetical protein